METINQPSNSPTNKVEAATAASAVWTIFVSIGALTLKNIFPAWYDPDLVLAVSTGVPTLLIFAAGWFRKDKATVVVITQEAE